MARNQNESSLLDGSFSRWAVLTLAIDVQGDDIEKLHAFKARLSRRYRYPRAAASTARRTLHLEYTDGVMDMRMDREFQRIEAPLDVILEDLEDAFDQAAPLKFLERERYATDGLPTIPIRAFETLAQEILSGGVSLVTEIRKPDPSDLIHQILDYLLENEVLARLIVWNDDDYQLPPSLCARWSAADPRRTDRLIELPCGSSSETLHALEQTRLLILLGSPPSIEPIQGAPAFVRERGGKVAVITHEPTIWSQDADFVFEGDVTDAILSLYRVLRRQSLIRGMHLIPDGYFEEN